jgi:hypothetical protein
VSTSSADPYNYHDGCADHDDSRPNNDRPTDDHHRRTDYYYGTMPSQSELAYD